MKKSVVTLITLLIVASCTTMGGMPESERFYQQVLSTPGDKNTLYGLVSKAVAEIILASTEGTIEYQDKDEGVLKGKGMAITKSKGGIAYTVTIEVKDDKTRITFQNMHYPSKNVDNSGNMSMILGNMLVDAAMVYDQGAQDQFIAWAETAIADIEQSLAQDQSDW